MKLFLFRRRSAAVLVMFAAALCLMPSMLAAQEKYTVQPIAEMKVKQLPKGELFWRVESFPTLDAAKTAAPAYRWNPDTVSYDGLPSLSAEVAGKAWLFTLGPKGGSTAGATKVAEIGPVPPLSAPEYLRNERRGRARNERTSSRDDHASVQQRDDRIDGAYHVRRRRDQAVLGAGQVRVRRAS